MNFDFNGILFALSYALDCVEHDVIGVTTSHGKRVAAIAVNISERLGIFTSLEERRILSACAVMHDSALSEYLQEEFGGSYSAAIQAPIRNPGKHCTLGEASMELMPFELGDFAGAVLYHHENADGTGPFGKKSDEIPPAAKVIQISDTIDALFDFSWIDEEKLEKLSAFLNENTGKLFDENVAGAFLSYLEEGDLSRLRNEKIDIYLKEMLPGGAIPCSPKQLIDFAGVFARIVDYKSHFTKTHSIGIAEKAHEMAVYYGADEELAAEIYFAGALHDIGKMVVDRDILEKPDKLDRSEYRHIQTHAYYSFKILSDIPGIEDITKWASFHHEKLDGTGYPFGLTGEKLDGWARLMACLDIYQALTEERPYKESLDHPAAMRVLSLMADEGKLDPHIVRDIGTHFEKFSTDFQ